MTPNLFSTPDAAALRAAMGAFVTGVAVVSTGAEGSYAGTTVNSLTSISLDPPIVLVAFAHTSQTGALIAATGRFGVSILEAGQEAKARRFAMRGAVFEESESDTLPSGLPAVRGALAWLDCEVVEQATIGDHVVFYGQVTALARQDGDSLAFRAGQFGGFHA